MIAREILILLAACRDNLRLRKPSGNVPAHGWGIGTKSSLRSLLTKLFYDSVIMILHFYDMRTEKRPTGLEQQSV